MTLGVLAKILEFSKFATAKHLPQKQKEPVDASLLSEKRLDTVILLTKSTVGQDWTLPNLWSTIVHVVHVDSYEGIYFSKLFLQIVFNLVPFLASLTLNITSDFQYSFR